MRVKRINAMVEQDDAEDKVHEGASRGQFMLPQIVEDLGQVVVRIHLSDYWRPVLEVFSPDLRQWLHGFHQKTLNLLPLVCVLTSVQHAQLLEDFQGTSRGAERRNKVATLDVRGASLGDVMKQARPLEDILLICAKIIVKRVFCYLPQSEDRMDGINFATLSL